MPARKPAPKRDEQEFSISELAHEFDITPRAIRFYEDHGLLVPRRDGQRRIYGARDRTRLRLTLRGKRLGFSLLEIRDIVDMYDAAGGDERPQLERMLAMLDKHRRSLLQQRSDIEAHLAEILGYERRMRQQLNRLAPGRRARRPRPV